MRIFTATMVNAVAAFGLMSMAPSAYAETQVQPSALMADLPFSPQFAAALADYRDCVLLAVDHVALSAPQVMAMDAMSACTVKSEFVQDQLIADIRMQNPSSSSQLALALAENGMQVVKPIVAQAAYDYAQDQIGRRVR